MKRGFVLLFAFVLAFLTIGDSGFQSVQAANQVKAGHYRKTFKDAEGNEDYDHIFIRKEKNNKYKIELNTSTYGSYRFVIKKVVDNKVSFTAKSFDNKKKIKVKLTFQGKTLTAKLNTGKKWDTVKFKWIDTQEYFLEEAFI